MTKYYHIKSMINYRKQTVVSTSTIKQGRGVVGLCDLSELESSVERKHPNHEIRLILVVGSNIHPPVHRPERILGVMSPTNESQEKHVP